MGQKTNTKNIFQIGKNNKQYIWDSKYFEKKKTESNIFIYKSIEIEKFIKKVLKDNGLILHKYKISFFESNIKISIFYIKLPKSQTIINQINNSHKLKLVKNFKSKNCVYKDIKKYLDIKKYINNQKEILNNKKEILNNKINAINYIKKKLKYQIIKIFLLNNFVINEQTKYEEIDTKYNNLTPKLLIKRKKIKKRIKILQYYKYYVRIKNKKLIKNVKVCNFLEKITESLNIFTNNKFNITLNFQQINNNLTFKLTSYHIQYFKKAIIQLRQFKKSKFFKEGINVIFFAVIKKESSQLLANFIANQLKLTKRHGFFLKFLKKALSVMLKSKLSKATSIKIIIKGRFNGKRRSSKKMVTINKHMPLMSIKSNIDSSQSTSYGSNGTFGVKLWMNEKNI